MSKRKTTEDFKLEARGVHGDRYDYANSVYLGGAKPILIGCKVHGEFLVSALSHIKGINCKKCADATNGLKKRLGSDLILKRLHASAYGKNYTYPGLKPDSKVVDKILMVCGEHGEFITTPEAILIGCSCPKCAVVRVTQTESQFLLKAEKVHGGVYEYPNFIEGHNHTKISILCKDHGLFTQSKAGHLSGYGCPVCGLVNRSEALKLPFADFKSKAELSHNGLYTYDESSYSMSGNKVSIACNVHGVFSQQANDHMAGRGCPACSSYGPSKAQMEIHDFLASLGETVVLDFRYGVNHKREVDVFVPSRSFGVELHGTYYHSSKFRKSDYHLNKHSEMSAVDLDVLHVFSDEWEHKKAQVKQLIVARLGLLPSVGARSCTVAEVSKSDASAFYASNHIQGGSGRGDSLGLYYADLLVAVMTLTQSYSSRGKGLEDGFWELSRFATSEYRVAGGASKLLKAFQDSKNISSLISYSDKRFFSGGMYKALGFSVSSFVPPNYTYVQKDGRRIRKEKYQRKFLPALIGGPIPEGATEKSVCESLGLYQIFDCGLVKWVLKM